MKPGGELDALVAEKVMGLDPHVAKYLRYAHGYGLELISSTILP